MIRRWKGLCARRSSCLLFQMFGVETSSFLPNEQSNGRDLARQGETSHRHFPSFGEQRGVESLKGSCGNTGQSGRAFENVFQIVIMIGIEPASSHELFGTLQLPLQETIFGAGASGQRQTAVGPQLPFGAETMRRLDQSDQQSRSNRADAGNLL